MFDDLHKILSDIRCRTPDLCEPVSQCRRKLQNDNLLGMFSEITAIPSSWRDHEWCLHLYLKKNYSAVCTPRCWFFIYHNMLHLIYQVALNLRKTVSFFVSKYKYLFKNTYHLETTTNLYDLQNTFCSTWIANILSRYEFGMFLTCNKIVPEILALHWQLTMITTFELFSRR